jgi:hypothetical protein
MTLTLVRTNIHSPCFTSRRMSLGYPHLCTLIQDTKFVSVTWLSHTVGAYRDFLDMLAMAVKQRR